MVTILQSSVTTAESHSKHARFAVQKLLEHEQEEEEEDKPKIGLCDKICGEATVWGSVKKFFAKIPLQIRILYIGAFLVHSYRPEWGNYIKWNPRLPTRPKYQIELKKRRRLARERSRRSSVAQKKPRSKVNKMVKTVTDAPPRPLPHNHHDCLLVRINVSGRIFEPQIRTLSQFPHTLLGNPKRMLKFYDPDRDEYFFDRHRTSFEAILSYFQTGGIIRKPQVLSLDHFLEEVKFYDLGHEIIKYLEDTEGVAIEENRPLPKNLLKRKVWLLFEYPESSYQSRILAYVSVLAVVLSIIQFCVETIPVFCWQKEHYDEEGKALPVDSVNHNSIFDLRDPFFLTETICVIFFVFEYLMRMLTSPHWFNFLKDFSNVIDLVSIIPFFVNLSHGNGEDAGGCGSSSSSSGADSLTVFRIIRLVRVFRILKLSRHNRGLKILGKTLKASIRELGLLVFFLMIGVVVFSSVMYFAEMSSEDTPFVSIPTGFWFSVVTMTTLGYGDLVPTSTAGKIVGALCAIAGVLTISLPVPVIVSNFNTFYNREELNELAQTRVGSDHVEQCPFYPGWYNGDGNLIGPSLRTKNDQIDPACFQWLTGELRPDYSDTDFEDLKVDEVYKKVRKEPLIKKRKTRLRRATRPSLDDEDAAFPAS